MVLKWVACSPGLSSTENNWFTIKWKIHQVPGLWSSLDPAPDKNGTTFLSNLETFGHHYQLNNYITFVIFNSIIFNNIFLKKKEEMFIDKDSCQVRDQLLWFHSHCVRNMILWNKCNTTLGKWWVQISSGITQQWLHQILTLVLKMNWLMHQVGVGV